MVLVRRFVLRRPAAILTVCLAAGLVSGCASTQPPSPPKASEPPSDAVATTAHARATPTGAADSTTLARTDAAPTQPPSSQPAQIAAPTGDQPSAAESPPPPPVIVTASEARGRAESALTKKLGAESIVQLSPGITAAWPTSDRKLLYVAYPMTANQKNMSKLKVGRPYAVGVDLQTGQVTVNPVSRSRNLKHYKERRTPAHLRENIARAEQLLVDVILGHRQLRGATGLDGYRQWFNANLDITTDMVRRYPRAMKWYRRPTGVGGPDEMIIRTAPASAK